MTQMTSQEGRAELRHQVLAEKQRSLRKSLWSSRAGMIVAGIAFITLWYAAGIFEWVDPLFLSDPLAVARYLFSEFGETRLWVATWATLEGAILGLVIGSVAGIASGLLLYEMPILRRALNPYITLANALPRPALAPIFLLWFGLGRGSKVAVSISIVYFVLLLNSLAGFDGVDRYRLFLAKSMGMGRVRKLVSIQLPYAMPSITAGLRLASVYSVLGVVVAEMVASYAGLGVLLVSETNRFNMAGAFGVLAILAVLAAVLDLGVSLLQRRFDWDELG